MCGRWAARPPPKGGGSAAVRRGRRSSFVGGVGQCTALTGAPVRAHVLALLAAFLLQGPRPATELEGRFCYPGEAALQSFPFPSRLFSISTNKPGPAAQLKEAPTITTTPRPLRLLPLRVASPLSLSLSPLTYTQASLDRLPPATIAPSSRLPNCP